MLRRIDHEYGRRLPARYLRASAVVAALATTALTGASFAHSGVDHLATAEVPAGHVPYTNGMADPLGVTLSGYAKAGATMHVAHAAHGGVAAENPLAAKVREVNARFADVGVAMAEGYTPIPCVSGVEGGAMGIHYVNGALIEDGVIEIGKPEAVMYEPKADGSLELVAVEYITTIGPANLDGHLFSFTNSPNRYGLPPFYELHVWAFRDNPTGVFADMNPNVTCDAVAAAK